MILVSLLAFYGRPSGGEWEYVLGYRVPGPKRARRSWVAV